jgi:PIN domain nuclease of toxin-antitoxin system
MRLLLDTHALLWAMEDDARLGPRARALLNAPPEAVYLSIASVWELAIKQSIGKLRLALPVEKLIEERALPLGIGLLPIGVPHIGLVESLPFHHATPSTGCLRRKLYRNG